MFRFLIVGLILSVSLTTAAFAQSGSKNSRGSGSKHYGGTKTSAMTKKQERQINKLKTKLVSQIVKTDFADIKLTKEQRTTLKELVGEKFEEIYMIDNQIGGLVPEDKVKPLMRAWKIATKEGKSNTEAIASSMKKVGLSEDIQKKVLEFNTSKEELLDEIRGDLIETFDDKQRKTLADAAAAKEAEAEADVTEKGEAESR